MSTQRTTAVGPGAVGGCRRAATVMLLGFLLSGAAALIYQILWARQLYLLFGVTIYATSAVVSAFMAGLALGSLYLGRLADRTDRPLLVFAIMEAGIAFFGLLFPLIVASLKPIYPTFYGAFGQNHYVMSLLRFIVSFAILIVPTSLMGGTLPVLTRAYVSHARRLGQEVAALYSANNLGAFLGCVLTGYAFVELLGLRGTLMLAVSLNLIVALLALWAERLSRSGPGPARAGAGANSAKAASLPRPVKVALWVFGIEGFTSLVYQMAWMRMLIFFVQSNIYAITAIVATFLAGLSAGAFVVRRWLDRSQDPYRMLGMIEVGIGVSAVITIPFLPWMMGLRDALQQGLAPLGWAGSTLARFAITFAVILLPTSFMGATMPVVARIYVPALQRLGKKMGVIGCLDTVGSVLGAFAGGFILIPVLGIQRTIVATALVNLTLAAWTFAADPVPRRAALRRPGFVAAVLLLVAGALMLRMEPMQLTTASHSLKPIERKKVLFYDEGLESTVSVVEAYNSIRLLLVNHVIVAQTDRGDRPSHEMIAHLPLLLDAEPRRALLIGFGIGFTARACRAHGVEVDVVELSRGVREANRFFKRYNDGVMADPRVHLIIDDGRNYVVGTRRRYDMIQAGIIHPGLDSGNAGFYTTDFYRECKRVLAPGGVMCQWLPLHGMSHEDFKMLIRSFQAVFPHASLWFKHASEFCVLIGTEGPLRIDFEDVERRVNRPAVRAHLARSGVQDVYDLLDSFCCAEDELRRRVGPGPVESDDRPRIEFHCSRPYLLFDYPRSILFLRDARRSVWPYLTNVPKDRAEQIRRRLARWFEGTQELITAEYCATLLKVFPLKPGDYVRTLAQMNEAFRRALEINPDDANARFLWDMALCRHNLLVATQAARAGAREEALRLLAEAMDIAPDTRCAARARYLHGRLISGREP